MEVIGLRTGSRPYSGPDTDTQLRALQTRERLSQQQIYTGPETSSQIIALRHLEQIARMQDESGQAAGGSREAVLDRPLPPARDLWDDRRRQPADTPRRAGAPRAPLSPPRQPRRRESRLRRAVREILSVPWPLYVVLATQAVLSLRLTWLNTAFLDEATYIWAGRVELWGLTTGAHVPAYSTYFSGAPSVYPPIAGIADIVGGLTAARLVSLAFMLGVTTLLWGATRSLFGQRAALSAVALFVIIGSTQFLGALATYDAMALFLLALSARLVIAARTRDDSTLLLIGAVAALVLANVTKYATGIFDPVVVAIAVLSCPRGLKAGLGRGGFIATITLGLLAVMLAIGGGYYLAGVEFTTLSRAVGAQSPSLVLKDSAHWIGVIVALSVIGVAIAWWRDRQYGWLVIAFAAAGILVPANQARIHTTVSLLKHVDFGAWFACIAAGYAIALLSRVSRRAWIRGGIAIALGAVILIPAGSPGRAQARRFETDWANTTQVVAELRPVIAQHPGIVMAEDPQVFGYYFDKQVRWQDWLNTWSIGYQAPGGRCVRGPGTGLSGPALRSAPATRAVTAAIQHQYYALIMLNFGDTVGVDHVIKDAIKQYGTYHLVAVISTSDVSATGSVLVWAPTVTGKKAPHGNSC